MTPKNKKQNRKKAKVKLAALAKEMAISAATIKSLEEEMATMAANSKE